MWWCFGTREEVSPRVVAWRPESKSTLSSPLYQHMLQFNAFSSLLQRGVGLSEFAMEFRNAAEWPISHCRMMGCEHSSFEGFVKYLVCSGRQKHSQRMATSPESPAIMVSTAESSAIIDTTLVFLGIMDVPHEVKRVSPGCWKLVSSLADPQLISDRAAGISPIVYNPVRELCACVSVLCEHVASVLVFCVPRALMSICFDPTHLVTCLLINFPQLFSLVTLLICSLYNLLVFAVPCGFVTLC